MQNERLQEWADCGCKSWFAVRMGFSHLVIQVDAMNWERLRELRKSTGLSMKQAAELSNTPYRTWQDWEGGKRRVPGIAEAWLRLWAERNTGA